MEHYKRFYGAFNQLPHSGERDELKQQLVLQFTGGRTDSLREMDAVEYTEMCRHIEAMVVDHSRAERKRKRRTVLVLLKRYGIDTDSWDEIDRFCLQKPIAGKRFGLLSTEELEQLSRKMRSIISKKS